MLKNIFTFLILLFFSFKSFAGDAGKGGGSKVTLAEGTKVFVEVIDAINSKNVSQGDTIDLRVKYDVKVDDQIVIASGTIAKAKIKHVNKAKSMGKPGSVELEVWNTTAVDGQTVSLNPLTINSTGRAKKGLSFGLTAGGCFVVGPLSLFFLLIKGEQGIIASGSSLESNVTAALNISTSGTTSSSSNASPAKTGDNQMRGGSDPFKGTNIANANKDIKVGKYYALLIGIDNYSGTWPPLKNAVSDAKAIESLLKLEYRVDVYKTLYNTQATRSNIINELEWLVNNVKENDNVLIYYSGHGEFKKELNKGFWVPSDATANSMSQFVSNNDIQTFLSGINSKHTLLISDACFSGDIFRGTTTSIPFENSEKYYFNVYNSKSRQAISSGGIEPVMDGGKNGHSVFAYYLLQALQTNEAKYYDAGQLFNKIKIPVVNNSEQSPNFNPIKNSGDEGGQFLFIKK